MSDDMIAWIAEGLAPIGTVSSRPLMGGRTLHCDGTVFAIVAFGELWFRRTR